MTEKPGRTHLTQAGALAYAVILWALIFLLRFIISDENLYLFAHIASAMAAFFLLGVILVCAFGSGLFVCSKLKIEFRAETEKIPVCTALGLGVISYLVFLLGTAGQLNPASAAAATAALFLLVLPAVVRFYRNASAACKDRPKTEFFDIILICLLAANAFFYLLPNFIPPLNYDSLAYHLAVPKRFIDAGRIHYIPFNVYSNFPMNMEFLYLLGLLLRDDSLARLLHFAAGLTCVLAVYYFCKRHFGLRAALISALAFYSIPYVGLLSGWAFNELLLSLYTLLAVIYLTEWIVSDDRGKLTISFIFCGLAMGTKYTAFLFLAPFILAAVIVKPVRERKVDARLAKNILTFLGICILVPLPWFLKNAVYNFNPVYPFGYNFFNALFGHPAESTLRLAEFAYQHSPRATTASGISALYAGISADRSLGSFFIAFIPSIFLVKQVNARAKTMLAYFLSYIVLWTFFTHQDPRFLIPALACLAVPMGYSAASVMDRGRLINRASKTLLLAVFLANSVWIPFHIARYDMPGKISGLYSREEYLSDSPLYQFPAFSFINSELPVDARILFIGENQTYYCNREIVSNSPLDKSPMVEIVNRSSSPGDIRKGLKDLSITHILLNYFELNRTARDYGAFTFSSVDKENLFRDFIGSGEYLLKLFEEDGVLIWKLL